MEIRDKVAIVTGAGSGIGTAIAQRLVADGARAVVFADLDLARAEAAARGCGGAATAARCDVSREDEVRALIESTRGKHGRVDIYVSNAGILGRGGIELDDALWNSMWQIHVMAHVWAARALMPEMTGRGEGYFVVTASAAGLLNIVESAPYGVTKHASVGFAEWLRIAYGRRGVQVSCLCPQAVQTAMTGQGTGSASVDGILQPPQVAEAVVEAVRDGRFLVLPHPEVLDYFRHKARRLRPLAGRDAEALREAHGGGLKKGGAARLAGRAAAARLAWRAAAVRTRRRVPAQGGTRDRTPPARGTGGPGPFPGARGDRVGKDRRGRRAQSRVSTKPSEPCTLRCMKS